MTDSKISSTASNNNAPNPPGKVIWADLKRISGPSLRIIIPLGCSVALIWWLFSKVNFQDMMQVLRHNVNYWWLIGVPVFTTLSYMIRGTRWGLQLKGVGVHIPYLTLWVSIFGAYALNLVMSGVGEAWRCLYIAKQGKVSLSKVIGTDVGDRSSDAVCVLVILGLTLLLAKDDLTAFVQHYAVGRDVVKFADNPWMWACIALGASILYWILHFFRNYNVIKKIDHCISDIWEGFKVLFTMPHKWWYLWLTIGIWICYYMQNYICFPAFPFSDKLMFADYTYGLRPGLVVCLFVSMSMAIPSSGGLGPWNLAMMFALSLYGIDRTDAAAFAMLEWSVTVVTQVLLGIFALLYVMITDRKEKNRT